MTRSGLPVKYKYKVMSLANAQNVNLYRLSSKIARYVKLLEIVEEVFII